MFSKILGRFSPLEVQALPVVLIASLVLLSIRIWVAIPFWKSGQTKWVEFPGQLSSGAKYLFQYEYKFHLGFTTLEMPFPEFMAWASGMGEIILPVLLVFGLFSRFAALGLLGMTLVIQFVYPSAWLVHLSWAIASGAILICGPGVLSADYGLRRLFKLR